MHSHHSIYLPIAALFLALLAEPIAAQSSPTDLASATDSPGFQWSTGGSAFWFSQTTTTQTGASAAEAGDIGNSEQSWMDLIVEGPDNLSFFWKGSSVSNYDTLALFIDGSPEFVISGEIQYSRKCF